MRVLVVEDSFDSRTVWVRLLKLHGFDARGADTLATARPLCAWAEAALLDMQLPDGLGCELVGLLPAGCSAITSGMHGWDRLAAAHGCAGVPAFPKPVDFNVVVGWLRQLGRPGPGGLEAEANVGK